MPLLATLTIHTLCSWALFAGPGALATMPPGLHGDPDSMVGVLIVAHGGGPDWNAQVETVARAVRWPGPVAVSYLMGPGAGQAPFQAMVDTLVRHGASQVVVVPMLVSSHSGHYEQVRFLVGASDSLDDEMQHHLQMSGITRPTAVVPLTLTPAMDDAPQVASVLAARALALATQPDREALFLIGHGPNSAEDQAAGMANLRWLAAEVKALTGFRSVLTEVVRDDAPEAVRVEAVAQAREMITLQAELTGRPVIVVPVLVANGRVTRETLPRDLVGLPVKYSGEALLADSSMAAWVEARVRGSLGRP
jgi:sirohydrochlorin cobaltochelatase